MPRSTLLLGIAGLLLVAGCGGGEGGQERSDRGSSDTEAPRRGTEPPASDADAVRPYIEDLLDEHNLLLNQILVDLEKARDRENVVVESYLNLFSPDSNVPGELLDGWVAMSEAGERYEPHDPIRPINAVRLNGDIEALSEDEAQFPICNDLQYQRVDANGQVIEDHPPQEHEGQGFAQRVDGQWRLWRIDAYVDTSECPRSGGS